MWTCGEKEYNICYKWIGTWVLYPPQILFEFDRRNLLKWLEVLTKPAAKFRYDLFTSLYHSTLSQKLLIIRFSVHTKHALRHFRHPCKNIWNPVNTLRMKILLTPSRTTNLVGPKSTVMNYCLKCLGTMPIQLVQVPAQKRPFCSLLNLLHHVLFAFPTSKEQRQYGLVMNVTAYYTCNAYKDGQRTP